VTDRLIFVDNESDQTITITERHGPSQLHAPDPRQCAGAAVCGSAALQRLWI